MALPFLIPAGITLVRLATGQLVKYGSKKAADSAVKNIGGKVIKKTTEKTYKNALTPTQLKNNPTFKDKMRTLFGMSAKQSKSMPRPGRINKKAGVAVGKQNKKALENRGIIKGTAGTVLASTALDMLTGDSNQKTEAKTKKIGGGQMKRNRKNVKTKVTASSDKGKTTTKKGLSPFEKAFAKARKEGKKTFTFKTKSGTKTFTTKLKETSKKKSAPKTMKA
tara:strand:- start:728 stop:1393 length:666 start_codon:yes stop_codon:yes gene_type:complete